ncbi:tripartite tricarboxylate transporter substrate binding protein [Arthrobacter nitrophenolicus]|uniref:Tripartite tricarboxylate transporter substrate binding protein n=1 Tax=Arthrobacter nitrophenolicus TaxID=683150 RepID=A0A4R5Y588_9MICC|nr:tripartite tricarboxylate transporter substrate binding protein [Arthrobacter nitrophenolicus]TDL39654.1 tripartite tricarboxylate transporter substrate binding protein [Arthrobacter nitrophenolicus]
MRLAGVAALVVGLVSGCSVGPGSQGGGNGAKYPDGPVEMVVTYQAGGASDQLARTLSPSLESSLGTSVIVQNVAGGSGTVGLQQVAKADSDGYSLAFIAGGPLTVQPHYGRTTYKFDDVRPVARVATAPLLLAVRSDAPWKTVQDLVAHLKKNQESFSYASTGAGNPANIAMEKFDRAAGVETKQVPFESSGEATTALLGGNVDAAAGLPSAFAASVQSGDLRILANLGDVKGAFYESVPTLKDSGYNAVTNVTNGLVAPKGVSDEVVKTLTDAVSGAIGDDEIAKKIIASGFIPDYGDGEAYSETLSAEYAETGAVLKELGLLNG